MPWERISIDDCLGCCDPCALGTTLDLVLSGITVCSCVSFAGGTGSISYSNVSGLNGSHSLSGGASGPWSAAVGSFDWEYFITDNGCGGDPDYTGSGEFAITLTCVDGEFFLQVGASVVAVPGTVITNIFCAAPIAIDTVTANSLTGCSVVEDCNGDVRLTGATGGTAIFSTP